MSKQQDELVGREVIFQDDGETMVNGIITGVEGDDYQIEAEGEPDDYFLLQRNEFELVEKSDVTGDEEAEQELTPEFINGLEKDELKVVAKDNSIKIPLNAYKSVDKMKVIILKALGFEVEEEKKSETKKVEKADEKKPVKPKVKSNVQQAFEIVAKILADGGAETSVYVDEIKEKLPDMSKGTINSVLYTSKAFSVAYGIAELRDKGLFLK